jgi:hypothetical protein
MATAGQLSVLEFMALIKVIAHPVFADFIDSVPGQYSFAALVRWLSMPAETLPVDIQEPFLVLQAYQNNHQRIAQETQQGFVRIREKFCLQPQDIQAYLADIIPKPIARHPPVNATPAEALPVWPEWMTLALLFKLLSYILFIALSYYVLHLSLVMIAAAFSVIILVPMLLSYWHQANEGATPNQETFSENRIAAPVFLAPMTSFEDEAVYATLTPV